MGFCFVRAVYCRTAEFLRERTERVQKTEIPVYKSILLILNLLTGSRKPEDCGTITVLHAVRTDYTGLSGFAGI